jgi:hypothetical protein
MPIAPTRVLFESFLALFVSTLSEAQTALLTHCMESDSAQDASTVLQHSGIPVWPLLTTLVPCLRAARYAFDATTCESVSASIRTVLNAPGAEFDPEVRDTGDNFLHALDRACASSTGFLILRSVC